MVMPIIQTCLKCGVEFVGPDAIGLPCDRCQTENNTEDCYTCIYFYDDGGELFGENPNCTHIPMGKFDSVMDGVCNCPYYFNKYIIIKGGV